MVLSVAAPPGVGQTTKRVVVSDCPHDVPDVEAAVAARHRAAFMVYDCADEAETAAATGGADVVLNNFAPMTRKVLAGLAKGAAVIRYGVGYDNVDVVAASELGVRVANVPDYGTGTLADHAAALLLALLRRLPHYGAAMAADGWCAKRAFGPLRAFASTTVGLVGAGRIGMALAQKLRGLGFNLIAYDKYLDPAVLVEAGIEPVGFEPLLGRAHAVSLHLPLDATTRHLIGAEALSWMRPDAVIVNTARGGLIDAEALAQALRTGALAGAGLDVFEAEPMDPDSPLRQMDQVILTPHVAFVSQDSSANLQRLAAEELDRVLCGANPKDWVNRPPA
ncbi:MAG: C-terminal binding protein [Bifidobacteriaceae bacterium]|jgi:D-3-phosphoglycerate dehydrogenase|nr:C-terminal binding protein [Bifidobacteriaceae bacterium]